MKNILYTIILSFLFSSGVFAYEVLDVCATYSNTNKSYTVEAKIYSGRELNRRTETYNYNNSSYYASIFWSNTQVTIIALGYHGYKILEEGVISIIAGTNNYRGVDQQGRPWSIRKGHDVFCHL